MFSNMLNQKKYVSRKQNFRRTIPLSKNTFACLFKSLVMPWTNMFNEAINLLYYNRGLV